MNVAFIVYVHRSIGLYETKKQIKQLVKSFEKSETPCMLQVGYKSES